MSRRFKVAVIGGGPSGIVTLKHLLTAHRYFDVEPIDAHLYESEAAMGGTLKYRVYEDAEMVSSKYLTAFSDFRLPDNVPDFLTPERYCQYLDDYCTAFDLHRVIHYGNKISKIEHPSTGPYRVYIDTTGDGTVETEDLLFDAVAICSGLNVNPDIPHILGLLPSASGSKHGTSAENITCMHSSTFKSREDFGGPDSTVVVLGAGETGMDIAHLAVTTPVKDVVLCHRDGFLCAPKIVPRPFRRNRGGIPRKADAKKPQRVTFAEDVQKSAQARQPKRGPRLVEVPRNKPIDCTVASLFDTAYVPAKLQRGQLLWKAYDMFIKYVFWLISGTTAGIDQWVGVLGPDRNNVDSLIFCKSDRAMGYISEPYRSTSLVNRVRTFLLNIAVTDTEGRQIQLATWPLYVDQDGRMHFTPCDRPEYLRIKDKVIKPNIIIYATGYTQFFPFLSNAIDEQSVPALDDANVRGIYGDRGNHNATFAYIGFVRPNVGAIPPLAELQAQLWVKRLVEHQNGTLTNPDPSALKAYDMDYKLHARGKYNLAATKLAVDHESYAYQLALDIGSAPRFTNVLRRGWRVLFTWAMGPNFNTKFLLVGPWKQEKVAEAIMTTELFPVVKETGGGVFFFLYTVLPFVFFGFLSMIYRLFGVV